MAVVVVEDVDVVDVAGTVVVVTDVAVGAAGPGAARVLGLLDRPSTNLAPIEEATATPNTERVLITALR